MSINRVLRVPQRPAAKTTIQVVGSSAPGQGACFILRGGRTIVLDCGASPSQVNEPIWYGETNQRIVSEVVNAEPDAIVITHYHGDHYRSLACVLDVMRQRSMRLPMIIATELTFKLLKRHIQPSSFVNNPRNEIVHCTGGQGYLDLIPNKHSVPGGASVLWKDRRVGLYTGDFYEIDLPAGMPDIDFLIVDSTGAMNKYPRLDNEGKIRENISRLMRETIHGSHSSKVYIALFSTHLERAAYILCEGFKLTGVFPHIKGLNLYKNLDACFGRIQTSEDSRILLTTGVWAQGESNLYGEGVSALVRLSTHSDWDHKIRAGDMVILSGSIPTWSFEYTAQIEAMCRRLAGLGARVVVDLSAPDDWNTFAEKQPVHAGGHGNLPEITRVIDKLRPKRVLPSHGSPGALDAVRQYCTQNGIHVMVPDAQSIITL